MEYKSENKYNSNLERILGSLPSNKISLLPSSHELSTILIISSMNFLSAGVKLTKCSNSLFLYSIVKSSTFDINLIYIWLIKKKKIIIYLY